METLLVAAGVVSLAEIGDKTQLLAFILAAKYKRPLPIVAGILVATLANHALAGTLGFMTAEFLSPSLLRWILAGSFVAMALWILIPDQIDESDTRFPGRGVFLTATILFFIAEMGDKTQVATVVLAAKYHALVTVVVGTTLGMLLANVPAAILGDRVANRLPSGPTRILSALIMLALGVAALSGVGADFGV